MARLPRLVVPGAAHYLLQRGHNGRAVVLDAQDACAYLVALKEAAAAQAVAVHAYAVVGSEVHVLATPPQPNALGSMMQAVGRRYVAGFNRRHGQSGTLWAGRYRAAVVEPGAMLLECMCIIDGLAHVPDEGGDAGAPSLCASTRHHLGHERELFLADLPEYWRLGNTPFEREAAYAALLRAGVPEPRKHAVWAAVSGGWAMGSEPFLQGLAAQQGRPLRPRPRGRPRKAV